MYADYNFYTDTYLSGKAAVISAADWTYYERLAEYYVRNHTLARSDSYTDGDEVKLATCELAEQYYSYDHDEKYTRDISSEHVGEYSVTYTAHTDAAKAEDLKAIMAKYLSLTGLLFKGADSNVY